MLSRLDYGNAVLYDHNYNKTCHKSCKTCTTVAALISICCNLQLAANQFHYRAIHFSAKRGLAIACRPSVGLGLSVRPSVCDVGGL